MGLRVLKAPTGSPVSVSQVKAWCKIETSAEDAVLPSMISTATTLARKELAGPILPESLQLQLDAFPASGTTPLDLECPRVIGIDSITYVDENGQVQTLAPSNYSLDIPGEDVSCLVRLGYNKLWPSTRDQANAVTVLFRAGWATDDKVPGPVKTWIAMHAADMVRNREAYGDSTPKPLPYLSAMLDPFRLYTVL